jgi:hypothetical protein
MKIFNFPQYVNEKTIKKIYDLNVNAYKNQPQKIIYLEQPNRNQKNTDGSSIFLTTNLK